MGRTIQIGLFAAIASVVFCATASADIIVDHPQHPFGGPGADTEFFISGVPFWQRNADDFVLAEPATIRQVRWWGFYGSTFDDYPEPPPDDETMRIRFYGAREADGLPDETAVLFEEIFHNPSRTATGGIIFTGPAPPEYVYEANLTNSLELQSDTLYWLEILQLGDSNSLFRWEDSPGTFSAFAFINPNLQDWRRTTVNVDLAFQLDNVPEPQALLMVLCAFFITRLRRKGVQFGRPVR